jgi:hypothetical protein
VPPPRAAACPSCPPRRRPRRGAPHAGLACLVARRASAATAARTQPGGPGRHRPPPDQRDFGSVARVPASATVDRAVDGPAATGPPLVPVVTVARSPSPGPQRRRLSMGGDGRVRTDGADTRRLDSARVDSRRLDTGRLDSRRPTAGPSGRPSQVTGHRTAGQPDAETGWVDTAYRTPATDAVACLLAVSTTATTPDLLLPAGRSSGQTPSGRATTRTAQQQGLRGHPHAATDGPGHRRDRQLQVVPQSSWRLGALLSCVGWYEGRAMGLRKGEGVRGRVGEAMLMAVLQ